MFKDFEKQLIKDIEVKLTQEFDRNFERKAFFNKKWPRTNHSYKRGSLLLRSGRGRRSIKSKNVNGQISWSSQLPYMSLHNEGGEIKVTAKMKRYFWAMYYKVNQARGKGKTQRNTKLTSEAAKWKAMALMKVGTVMTIKQRQFIGWHPMVDKHIKTVTDVNLKELNEKIIKKLK